MQPVMAVDIGSATITAAAAIPSNNPDPDVLHIGDSPGYGTAVKVDVEGTPHPATWAGKAVDRVERPLLLLDKPPQIVGDVPLSGATLVGVSVAPAMDAARRRFGTEPFTIIGVHPHWPEGILADYRRALGRLGQDVALVPWAEAIAAQTTPPLTGSHVTVLDFGASTATVVLVEFSRRGKPSVAFTHTDPAGGSRGVDRAVVAQVAHTAAVALDGLDAQWWEKAAKVAARGRMRSYGQRDTESVTLQFPAPLGGQTLTVRDIRSTTNRRMQTVVENLTGHTEVQQAWESDRSGSNIKPILEATGGFALDPAVELAVRATVGPVTVVDQPAGAAAFGAVMLEAPKWIPATAKAAKPRRSLFRSRA